MADARFELVTRLPAPPLRAFIDRYVGYRLVGSSSGVHRGLPSRHLTCIVSIGEPIDVVAQTDPRQAPARYDFVVGGLQATSALVAHGAKQEGVAVELTPLGCRSLLGMPARALWNTSLEAHDVVGRAATELRERLSDAPGWSARFAVVDQVLGRLADLHARVDPEVREAWRLLVATRGTVPVSELATEVGWGRRHLARRFRDEFGLSPKLAARVLRFERARRVLRLHHHPGIAYVAAACSYYDQPHLNRDFVEMAGCAPGEWLATEVPSVQDVDPLEPSGSPV